MKVCVIGAGPSGMIAAGMAAQNGAEVILLERNDSVGRKLLITGKGRCNVTNDCNVSEFMESVATNSKFLYSAINKFSSADVMNFFEKQGCRLKVERGKRVFPVSDKSRDIVQTLLSFIKKQNVNLFLHKRVNEIIKKNQEKFIIRTSDGESFESDRIIIACGGCSYPRTGSTGDGYKLSKRLGHRIIEQRASLVPIVVEEQSLCKELQGLSLKNVSIEVIDKEKNKVIYKDFGEMLFTHFGVSGPIILSASAHMKNKDKSRYAIVIDLKPAITYDQLDARIQRDFLKNLHKQFSNSLSDLLPKKAIPVIIKLSKINPELKCDSIKKEMRKDLIKILKRLTLNVKEMRDISEAIITSGGIDVKEINPKTMESKLIKGLYFAGEVIDVDAYTGGFNLQIAFCTGYLAGISCVI